jgi:chromosome segregation ATPase
VGVMDLIRRAGPLDDNLEELQVGMAEALNESMAHDTSPPVAAEAADPVGAEPSGQAQPEQKPSEGPESPAAAPEALRRLSAHSLSRLAALESFEKLYRETQDHLRQVEGRIAEITTSQQLTRRFFTILHADINRTNDLETANAALTADLRKSADQVSELTRKLQERDALIEGLQQRETSIGEDNEQLRASLSAAKLELVEAANASAGLEAKLGEAVKALSGQTVDAERRARENQTLREKQVNLQIELDKALKQEAQAQRRIEEMSAIHASENAQHAELVAALSKSEKEVSRLQMAAESAQMKQAEITEAALIAAGERDAEARRMQAEMGGLRAEMEAAHGRLAALSDDHSEALSRVSSLKAQLKDARSEREVLDEKLASLMRDYDQERLTLSAATANISQINLQRETEQIQLDIHRQECEDLRAEILTLNQRIMELLPFERLYKATMARQASGLAAQNSEPASGLGAQTNEPVEAGVTAAAKSRKRPSGSNGNKPA